MKYLVLLADGVADYPLTELNGKTPLQFAAKPNIDRLVPYSEIGMVKTVPDGFPPGSDVANLSVMGYDPRIYYTGRAPLEAVSIGVTLENNDVAFRCNLVTLTEAATLAEQIMVDYSSDEITTPEARSLMKDLNTALAGDFIEFYSGFSYRHLMVWRGGPDATVLTPPHDISDRRIGPYLPKGSGAEVIIDLIQKSRAILKNHPVNLERITKGLRPATAIWLWGQGKKPRVDSFTQKYRLQGAVISAVDLIKGLGICAGLKVIEVPGATGNINTNFQGKAAATVTAFKDGADFIYLHFEAPDEAGHRGELDNKIKSVEKIDAVLGFIIEQLPSIDPEFKIMFLPDHPTPLKLKTHVADPVPFLIYDSTKMKANGASGYDEFAPAKTGLVIETGHSLMDRFIGSGGNGR